MDARVNFFLISIFVFLIPVHAGTWDSFEIGQVYEDDPTKCFSSKHSMDLNINAEYQVPDKCATIMCHESYVISERELEVNKEYTSVGSCGKFTCDDKAKLNIVTCAVGKYDKFCTSTDPDLTKSYPDCCPKIVCS